MHGTLSMDRRMALKAMAGAFGITLIPALARAAEGEAPLGLAPSAKVFTPAQRASVAALSERIVPTTDTPGAISAGVPAYIEMMLGDWFYPPERASYLSGIDAIEAHSRILHKKSFARLKAADQDAVITDLMNGKVTGAPNKFFETARQMVVTGYYTSEIGATVERVYLPVPGPYDGNHTYSGRVFSG